MEFFKLYDSTKIITNINDKYFKNSEGSRKGISLEQTKLSSENRKQIVSVFGTVFSQVCERKTDDITTMLSDHQQQGMVNHVLDHHK